MDVLSGWEPPVGRMSRVMMPDRPANGLLLSENPRGVASRGGLLPSLLEPASGTTPRALTARLATRACFGSGMR